MDKGWEIRRQVDKDLYRKVTGRELEDDWTDERTRNLSRLLLIA